MQLHINSGRNVGRNGRRSLTGNSLLHFFALVGLLLIFLIVNKPSPVSAAACTMPSTDYGSVTSTISVPSTATYRVWSRIQVPNTSNTSYMLEIDGTACFTVGGSSSIPVNTWTWIDYQSGNTGNKINAALSAGSHTIKMIGLSDGVLLDRLIFTQDTTGSACNPPTGVGDSCANASDTTPPTVTITSPANNATVKGNPVNISANTTDSQGISKVEFLINGAVVNTDTSSPYTYPWDTTKGAPDGSYTLTVKAYDNSGNSTVSSAITVAVKNAVVSNKPGDANNDGKIDLADYSVLSNNWGRTGVTLAQGDFNGDGKVDLADYSILSNNWGK